MCRYDIEGDEMAVVGFREKDSWQKNLYCNENAVENVIGYIFDECKMPHKIIGGIGVSCDDKETAISQFKMVKEFYRNQKGKKVIHFWVSFEKQEILSVEEYLHIGYMIADFFDENYQIIFALHENTDNDHLHFVVNTVSYKTGKKLRWHKGDRQRLMSWIESIV